MAGFCRQDTVVWCLKQLPASPCRTGPFTKEGKLAAKGLLIQYHSTLEAVLYKRLGFLCYLRFEEHE